MDKTLRLNNLSKINVFCGEFKIKKSNDGNYKLYNIDYISPCKLLNAIDKLIYFTKEETIPIIILSNNPCVIRGIEIYSAKHELADVVKYFYRSGLNNLIFDYTGNLDIIYSKYNQAFQKLENERYAN